MAIDRAEKREGLLLEKQNNSPMKRQMVTLKYSEGRWMPVCSKRYLNAMFSSECEIAFPVCMLLTELILTPHLPLYEQNVQM